MRCLLSCALLLPACSQTPPVATIPYEQDFSTAKLGPEWSSADGGWKVVGGRLFNDGAHNVPLWLSAALPANVRVVFDAESKSDAVDLKFEIFGDGKNHQSGYVVILAGWNNSKSIIARLNEHGRERTGPETAILEQEVVADGEGARTRYLERQEIVARYDREQASRVYHFRFERLGHSLKLFVDDALYLSYFDPSPLAGLGHDHFAFNNWASQVYFDNLRIEALPESP